MDNSIAAPLFEAAESLQNEARELQHRLAKIYNTAGELKNLALRLAVSLEPVQENK
jgi:hypothetical protein